MSKLQRNEKTSKSVATDAATILNASPEAHEFHKTRCVRITLDLWERCRRVAGSALTQVANKPAKPAARPRRRSP